MSQAPRASRPGRLRTAVMVLFAGLLAVAGLSACAAGPAAQNGPDGGTNYVAGTPGTTPFQVGHRPVAPTVAGSTLTGQRLSLASYHGKVVVLNFWASWCPPCRSEAPVLAQLSRAYQAKGVQFVGIDTHDPGQANGQAYARSFGIGYPSLYDPAEQVLLVFRTTVPPSAIPTTLVIDQTGRIAARIIGPVGYTGLKDLIDGLTQAPSPRGAASASSPGKSAG